MQHVDSDNNSSDYEVIFQDNFTNIDSSSDIEEILNSDSNEESKLLYLTKMGFSEAEGSIAMERCGPDSSITELTDFICADKMAKAADVLLPVEDQITQRTLPEDAIGSPYFYYEQIHLSNLMIGFGVHTKPDQITQRTLPEDAIGSPYFYYENMALAPVNVWTGISQYLFDVEPEFVDSKHFHAVTLKIGYIHNLPIENRFPLILSAKLTERICKALEAYDDEPHLSVQKYVSLKIIHEDLYRDMFHGGINVLSLFSGINDEEVAFYCLGILLKTDVQELNDDRLEQLMSSFVEFDLVVSGIQRTNLTGRNKHHQDELDDFCWCISLQ
ncbi:DNA (Cytosine-5)-methyltransferase DRM1/2 isoform 2 [Hibiscus syriacus]|uniref:DNA (Cytosine-5)-methyltransferase DRM1/2 isoform 2 n=1 Tax=Hibiscus syriacus TaxID=106335 RepID=A0A6A2Z0U6_HIBSY|nr:DNA (Cytosine-5)-methyltransferase DRM1/2 isoform 2 [Hibiscus syriacus]